MISGDFPRHPHGLEWKIFRFLSWSKLYLVLYMTSFLFLAASKIHWFYGRATRMLFFPLFFLVTTFMFSVLFSQDRRLSLEAMAYFFSVIFTVYMISLILDDENLLDPLWAACSLGIIFLAAKTVSWRLHEGLNFGAYLILNNSWAGKLQIAWVLNFFAPFLFARYLLTTRYKSWLAGIAWAASGVAVFILYSRAGTFIFGLSSVILCALHRERWKKWIVPAVITSLGVMMLAAKSVQMTKYVVSSTARFFIDESLERRMNIWRDTLTMFADHPLTGIGFGAYDELAYSRYGAPYGRIPDNRFRRAGWHAHNLHLHLLAETGIIGILAWLYFIYAVLSLSVERWRESASPIAKGTSQALFLFFSIFLILSMTENLLAVRVHQSLRMNLTVWFLILLPLASIRSAEKIARKAGK